jgi:hypothetical protein
MVGIAGVALPQNVNKIKIYRFKIVDNAHRHDGIFVTAHLVQSAGGCKALSRRLAALLVIFIGFVAGLIQGACAT